MASPDLDNLLTQQLSRLGQLFALLEQETDALVKREVEQIEQLLKRKVALLDEIKMADVGISRHPALPALNDTPELVVLMDQCQGMLQQCQQRNQHNHEQAELVAGSLTRLQQVLQRTSHNSAMTYTGEGNTHVGQRLGKAIKA
ncbi:flagellar protein FlgN [uncultured Ferrimonas sp.]|uniref:flagella synthesis protein FlgN n=1 Tax=uncultured Ferrimonas sp. TaxID=432640 RepID=UPI002618775C|nr:flagellar protein FlgN [uncultured Ferrimonas sp.]